MDGNIIDFVKIESFPNRFLLSLRVVSVFHDRQAMLNNYFSSEDVAQFRVWMEWADNYVIMAHKSPDGDAVGSSLALCLFLQSKGKNVKVVFPDCPPDFLMWMSGASEIMTYDSNPDGISDMIYKADVLCCLDFNSPGRVEGMAAPLLYSRAKKIMIDHHPNPSGFCDVILSHPDSSSTSELVFHLLCALGEWGNVTRQIAECICTGMITDTGGFAYNSNSSQFFYIISQLIDKNVDKDALFRKVFNNYSEYRLRLTGFVLTEKMRIYEGCRTALITLSQSEQERYHCQSGDTEGFANMPLQISGVLFSVFMREFGNGKIRVSLRSTQGVPCDRFSGDYFHGGGHRSASGGEFIGTLDECVRELERGLEEWRKSDEDCIIQLFR